MLFVHVIAFNFCRLYLAMLLLARFGLFCLVLVVRFAVLLFAFFFYYKRLLTDEILAYIAVCTTPFCLSNFLANCLQG